jgi:hypothetical protein
MGFGKRQKSNSAEALGYFLMPFSDYTTLRNTRPTLMSTGVHWQGYADQPPFRNIEAETLVNVFQRLNECVANSHLRVTKVSVEI